MKHVFKESLKNTLKKTLTRLTTGFVSSLMVMSFILMPIPRVNIAHADDQPEDCKNYEHRKGDVYKAGCELDDVLTTTTFDSSARYNSKGEKIWEKIPGMIEQYIVALTGVILINSLNWKRLHLYNPLAYGNDCPRNFGHKIGMPMAALAGLSNTVGDLISNIEFQNQAKKATDYVATIRGNPTKADESSEDAKEKKEGQVANNLQIEAFEKLIEVMNSQNSALKTKKGTALAASIGFGVADGVEIANMLMMNNVCSTEWGLRIKDKGELTTLRGLDLASKKKAIAISSASANPPGVAACTSAELSGVNEKSQKVIDDRLANIASIDAARVALKEGKKIKSATDFLLNLPSLSEINYISKFVDTAIDETIETTDESLATTKSVAIAGYLAKANTSATADLIASKGCTVSSGDASVLITSKKANASSNNDRVLAIKCCGGDGLSLPINSILEKGKLAFDSTNVLNAVFRSGKELVKKKLINKIVSKAVTSIIGVKPFINLSRKDGKAAPVGKGSSLFQGVPPLPGLSSYKKDIKVLNLFGNVSAGLDFSPELTPEKSQEIENLKFFFKNSFEAQVRRFAETKYNFGSDETPMVKLERFVEVNKQVDSIMKDFSDYVDQDFYYLYNDGLPNSNHPKFRNVLTKISDLIIPKAHAGIGATLMAAAPGLVTSAVGGMVKGPWSSVLKLGGNILTLHGLLGKFLKRTGLTSPIGRTITWAAMSALAGVSYDMTASSLKRNEKNKKFLEDELEKFKDSSGGLGVDRKAGSGILKLTKGQGGDNIFSLKGKIACVKKAKGGYAPTVCTGVKPKKRFAVAGFNTGANRQSNSLYIQGANTLSDLTTLSASGNLGSNNFDSATIAKMERLNNAIRAKNDKHRKEYDKQMKSGDKEIAKRSGSLANRVAKIRKALLKNAQISGGSPFLQAAPVANEDSTEKEKNESPAASVDLAGINSNPPTGVAPSMDFDLDDEDDYGDIDTDSTSSKKAVSIDEYVVKHDDISKKKDVSIFKILSNRYILSYPKIIKEKQ